MSDNMNTSAANTYGNLALPLYEKGWPSLVPIVRNKKKPAIDAWQRSGPNPPIPEALAARAKAFPDCGIGFVYGGGRIVGIDLDFDDPDVALEAEALVTKILGLTPLIRGGRKSRSLRLYQGEPGLQVPGKNFGGFEIFYNPGVQTVFYGTHPDGFDYQWLGKSPLEVSPGELPLVTTEQIEALVDALNALTAKLPGTKPHHARHLRARGSAPAGGKATTGPAWMVRNVLARMRNDDGVYTYDDWIAKGHAIHAATGGSEEGREIFVDWSNQQSKAEKDPGQTWLTFHPDDLWGLWGLMLEAADRVDADIATKIAAGEEPEFKRGMNAVAAAVFDDNVEPDQATIDTAHRRDAPRRRAEAWVSAGNPYKGMDIGQLVDAASRILRGSAAQVENLLKAALALDPTDLEMDGIVNAIADGDAKIGKRVCKDAIKRLKGELAAALKPTPDEQRAMQEAAAAGAELVRQQQIAELEARVLPLASDPNLLERFLLFAAERGVVNERAGSLGIFLTLTSRLNRRKALSLLRSGAAAGGKNFPLEMLIVIMPAGSLHRVTSASDKALVYEGGIANEDELKHTVIYVRSRH